MCDYECGCDAANSTLSESEIRLSCVKWGEVVLPVFVECSGCWVQNDPDGNPDLARVSKVGEGSYLVRRENLPEVLRLLTGPVPEPVQ